MDTGVDEGELAPWINRDIVAKGCVDACTGPAASYIA
jgi:hypothetical protein